MKGLDIGPLCVYLLELISTCCSCLLNLGQVDSQILEVIRGLRNYI